METRWELHRPDEGRVTEIRETLQCDPVVAAILVNRGVAGAAAARAFLRASPSDLRSPFLLADMEAAVTRIHDALVRREKILVFGDYDADGVTATALLREFLHLAGADVSCRIPHRTLEGYGLSAGLVAAEAVPGKIGLIITVDCGISGYDAVEAASAAGIDVIVTDHHIPPGTLPRAVAVVNPNRTDCRAGLEALAGVGVVFFLVMALRKHLRDRGFWKNRTEPNLKALSDLVALGTIADMVPLTGENRILSRMGLAVLNSRSRPGIRALMEIAGHEKTAVDAEDVAFKLAPRLNAAGRLAHADTAYRLLSTASQREAARFARALDDLNRRRRGIESAILEGILRRLDRHPLRAEAAGIVLSGEDWHEGVLGIVASRLVRKLGRPVVLLSVKDGVAKGSGRSVPGLGLLRVLEACAADLETFGGHDMAAGLRMNPEKIPDFERRFAAAVREAGGDAPSAVPRFIDAELGFDGITRPLLDQLDRLGPFGAGNPQPLFVARDVRVKAAGLVGKTHRRMRLTQASVGSGRVFNAIQFNVDPAGQAPPRFEGIVYRPRWNHWNGSPSLQLVVEAALP